MSSIREKLEVIDKIRALVTIAEQGRIGRKALAERLGVGEGYLRKLLDRLAHLGIIGRDREGAFLTEAGRSAVAELTSAIRVYRGVSLEGYRGSAVVVSGAEAHVKNGLEERDEAVRFGARGAMIMVMRKGELWFPMVSNISREHPELSRQVIGSFGLRDGDVLVFAWDGESDSERAALAAALLVLERAGRGIPSL